MTTLYSLTSMVAGSLFALLIAGCVGVDAAEADTLDEVVGAAEGRAPSQETAFDTDRQQWIVDTDKDTYPDMTEELEGTDSLDPNDIPGGSPPPSAGFPSATCRSGFINAGSRLCITSATQNATSYRSATAACRDRLAHVCTHEDLSYLYLRSSLDASFNPSGKWIGNIVGDDDVLCGNKSVTFDNDPDTANFEGECNKADLRAYWCCHDDNG